jgi:hypothetical protein
MTNPKTYTNIPTDVDYSDCDEWEMFILFGDNDEDGEDY